MLLFHSYRCISPVQRPASAACSAPGNYGEPAQATCR